MHFDLTEDQKEIKRVAHELLAERSPMARVREAAEAGQYRPELWREIVELGWPGIAVAEEHGGQGLGAVELAVLAEELGYACAATPFLPTAVAAVGDRRPAAPTSSAARWLPGLVSGELTAGVGGAELAADAVGRRRWSWCSTATRRGCIETPAGRDDRHDRLDPALRQRQRHRRGAGRRAPPTASGRRWPPRSSGSPSGRST